MAIHVITSSFKRYLSLYDIGFYASATQAPRDFDFNENHEGISMYILREIIGIAQLHHLIMAFAKITNICIVDQKKVPLGLFLMSV